MMFWVFFSIGAFFGSGLVLILFCINSKPDTTTFDRRKVDRESCQILRNANVEIVEVKRPRVRAIS